MALILDTNALSAWVEGESKLTDILNQSDVLIVPSIAYGEFYYGIQGSRLREEYLEWLHFHIAPAMIYSVRETTAILYASIRRRLKAKGRPIPWHDIWIAACAVEQNLPLLSRDRHFDEVEDLERISW